MSRARVERRSGRRRKRSGHPLRRLSRKATVGLSRRQPRAPPSSFPERERERGNSSRARLPPARRMSACDRFAIVRSPPHEGDSLKADRALNERRRRQGLAHRASEMCRDGRPSDQPPPPRGRHGAPPPEGDSHHRLSPAAQPPGDPQPPAAPKKASAPPLERRPGGAREGRGPQGRAERRSLGWAAGVTAHRRAPGGRRARSLAPEVSLAIAND